MKLASTSSRENPSVVWVRSLVPKLKNSAWAAIRSAIRQARGSSIIVPTEYAISVPASRIVSSATALTRSSRTSSSDS